MVKKGGFPEDQHFCRSPGKCALPAMARLWLVRPGKTVPCDPSASESRRVVEVLLKRVVRLEGLDDYDRSGRGCRRRRLGVSVRPEPEGQDGDGDCHDDPFHVHLLWCDRLFPVQRSIGKKRSFPQGPKTPGENSMLFTHHHHHRALRACP